MSLDLIISPLPCPRCGKGEGELEFNYTYNVSPMWFHMFPEDKGMVYIDGMTGKEADIKLKEAIRLMKKNKEELIKLEPENEWGSYNGFLEFLKELLYASKNHSESTWRGER
jgi:hypothetical protein